MKRTLIRLGLSALMTSALFGCGGGGSDGVPGTTAPPVTVTTTGPGINPATITAAQWANLEPRGTINSVTINSPPVVTFTMTDANGNAIVGLESITSQSLTAKRPSYPNLGFSVAKLVPGANNSPSRWVSYEVLGSPSTTADFKIGKPSTENYGTLEAVAGVPGQYKYTFYRDPKTVKSIVDGTTDTATDKKADLDDLSYDANLTHRVGVQFAGPARGTGTNTSNATSSGVEQVLLNNPVNFFYDFIPATGKPVTDADTQREIVSGAACFECHTKFVGFHNGIQTENVLPASRQDPKMCVLCHTDQRKFGTAEATTNATGYSSTDVRRVNGNATLNMMPFIHTLHMGSRLTKTGMTIAGLKTNDIVYPQSVANCAKCHTGSATATTKTLNGDNWKAKPSRLACGSCHDAINFVTGANHNAPTPDNVQTDDSKCANCHNATSIAEKHAGENATLHNPIVKAGLKNFKYEIKSASQATAGGDVKVEFRILMDGVKVDTLAATTTVTSTTSTDPLVGFTGSPSFLLAYAKSQDGVAMPVDYNNLGNGVANAQPKSVSIANLLNPARALTVGTLAGPDSDGYYTATIVGSNKFPLDAKLRTVALQGYFTQITAPATASAGIGRHTLSVVQTVTGDTVRRSVVDSAKCGNCHEWFEGHGGNRNIGADSTGKVPAGANIVVCVVCHNPGIVTSGRGIADSVLNPWLFTTSEKELLASWGVVPTATNAALSFPQVSNNFKDMIHGIHAGKDRADPIRIARDSTSRGVIDLIDGKNIKFPGNLQKCESCHKPGTYSSVPANTLVSTYEADNSARTGTAGARTAADAKASLATPNVADSVTTPFTAACVSCHDKATPIVHMKSNGGQILVARNAANSALETCSVCHAAGRDADPAVVHKK